MYSRRMEPVFDAHCDTFLWQYADHHGMHLIDLPLYSHFSGDRMRKGGVNIEVFATFVPGSMVTKTIGAKELALQMITEGKDYLNQEGIQTITNREQLSMAESSGSFGILGLEGAFPLGNDPMEIHGFYDLGVRILTIVWSRKNNFASGVGFNGGLTGEGIELIELANELGIVVDISHMNAEGVDDVLQHSKKPIIASHSNAFDLNPHFRNISFDQIEEVSRTGGVVCVNFCPDFLTASGDATIHDVLDHIEKIIEVGGIRSVGIGSDFDGIPVTPRGLEDISKVSKLKNMLGDRGLKELDIEKIMGGNLKRVFMDVMK